MGYYTFGCTASCACQFLSARPIVTVIQSRGCQETWHPVSTYSLLPGSRPVLSLFRMTGIYCWLSNTSVSPSLFTQPFQRDFFFSTCSSYCTDILCLWTFPTMMMGNVLKLFPRLPLATRSGQVTKLWDASEILLEQPKRHSAFFFCVCELPLLLNP